MKLLHLTLKKQWFDMIASGEKKEEYRQIKPYWERRLIDNDAEAIHFRNGYSKGAPAMIVQLKNIGVGLGNPHWGAPAKPVYVLELGEILEVSTRVVEGGRYCVLCNEFLGAVCDPFSGKNHKCW